MKVFALAAALGTAPVLWCAPAIDLQKELDRSGSTAGGRVGVAAVLIESGEHVAFHGDQPSFMASTVKFPVALTVLHLVEDGKLHLDQKVAVQKSDVAPGVTTLGGRFKTGAEFTIRDLLGFMILNSDNTACDVLLRLSGGPRAVMARVQALGIEGMRADRSEKELAADYKRSHAQFLKDRRDTSTPDAMVALLAKFHQGETLNPPGTLFLREMLQQSTTGPNRLKGLLPPSTVVAHKTGTWGEAAMNDVGVITLPGGAKHIAIAVFVSGSTKETPIVERAIAEMARAVYDHWSQP